MQIANKCFETLIPLYALFIFTILGLSDGAAFRKLLEDDVFVDYINTFLSLPVRL